MLSILDKYILKRYLGTFVLLLLLFIPIGIIVNLAEKIDKILDNEVPFMEVVTYYFDFTIYFANFEVNQITDKNKNKGNNKLAKKIVKSK